MDSCLNDPTRNRSLRIVSNYEIKHWTLGSCLNDLTRNRRLRIVSKLWKTTNRIKLRNKTLNFEFLFCMEVSETKNLHFLKEITCNEDAYGRSCREMSIRQTSSKHLCISTLITVTLHYFKIILFEWFLCLLTYWTLWFKAKAILGLEQ